MSDPEDAPAPERPRRRGSVGKLLIGFLLFLVAAGAIVYTPLVRHLVREHARKHGVDLRCEGILLRPGRLSLEGCDFQLRGVESFEGHANSLHIDLAGADPVTLNASDVTVELSGSAHTVAIDISAWASRYPHVMGLPAGARGLVLHWRRAFGGKDAWLAVEAGEILPHANGGRLTIKKLVYDGIDAGTADVRWDGDGSAVHLGLGGEDGASIELEVKHKKRRPTATLVVGTTPLEKLATPLNVPLPIEGARVSMRVDVEFGERPLVDPILGTIDTTLDGYSPPVPGELQGFVWGKKTRVTSAFRIDETRRQVELKKVEVVHGAIRLKGDGKLTAQEQHAIAQLKLRGSLSCSQLADAATRSRLPGQIGTLLGQAARVSVGGSVSFGVDIRADTRNLKAAQIKRHVGIGCGLRALGDILPRIPPKIPGALKDLNLPIPQLLPERRPKR